MRERWGVSINSLILGLVVVLVALTVKVAIVVLVLKAGEEDIFLGFRRGKGVIGGVKLKGGNTEESWDSKAWVRRSLR